MSDMDRKPPEWVSWRPSALDERRGRGPRRNRSRRTLSHRLRRCAEGGTGRGQRPWAVGSWEIRRERRFTGAMQETELFAESVHTDWLDTAVQQALVEALREACSDLLADSLDERRAPLAQIA